MWPEEENLQQGREKKDGCRPDMGVVVCVYNPKREKLLKTIESILMQKDIRYQIIIADDGSEEDYFDEAKRYMEENNFYDYQFVKNKTNRGTVLNCLGAVSVCGAEWVKLLSPGDRLYPGRTLREWVDEAEKQGAGWSFGDAVYYREGRNGQSVFIREDAHPGIINVYLQGDMEQCRKNYLINNDICLGAATICRKDLLLEYLKEIAGKVIYAEDNIYRLMMMDGLKEIYFPKEVIFYEFGEGVSTSGSVAWQKRLKKDWDVTSELILEKCTGNGTFEKKVRKSIEINNISNQLMRYFQILLCRDMFIFRIRKKIKRRKTKIYSDYENFII